MRITVEQLRKIISEEVSRLLEEKPKAASPSLQFKKRKVGAIEKPKKSKKKDDKKTPVKESAEKKKSLVESIMAITDEEKAQWSRGNYSFISEDAAERGPDCAACGGEGLCPDCGGTGENEEDEDGICADCDGSGDCPECGGEPFEDSVSDELAPQSSVLDAVWNPSLYKKR